MILAGLSLELVCQLVLSRGIAVLHGGIVGALDRFLVKPQVVSGDLWLLLQHPTPSGLVLVVTELLGGPVDQLLSLELHSCAH